MASLLMKGPRNCGGFTVGPASYAPDAEGNFEIDSEHVDVARSHGLVPVLPEAAPAPEPAGDPNIERAGGVSQPVVQPGGDATGAPNTEPPAPPAPEPEAPAGLTDEEASRALADAATSKGALLTDEEKASVLAAATAAKNAPAADGAPGAPEAPAGGEPNPNDPPAPDQQPAADDAAGKGKGK